MSVSREEFLKQVETCQKTVYPEDAQIDASSIFIPFGVEGLAILTGIALIWLVSLVWRPYPFAVFLLLLIGPMLVGAAILLIYLRRKAKEKRSYGIRGISRTLLSRAIFFLDMIEDGQIEVGKVKGPSVPHEAAATATLAFGAAVHVLKKIDKELAITWVKTLQDNLRPEVSGVTIGFIRVTFFGSIISIPVLVILEILRSIGIIPTEIAVSIMIALFSLILVMIGALSIYAVRSARREVPAGARDAIAEPELRFDTEQALEKLIEVYEEEGKYPLRVLMLGDNEEFVYTDCVYETTKGYTLRAAVLFPNQTTSSPTDNQWTD